MKSWRFVGLLVAVAGTAVFGQASSPVGQNCPEEVGRSFSGYPSVGEPILIEVSGSRAFVVGDQWFFTGSASTISILDISEPDESRILSQVGGWNHGAGQIHVTDLSAAEDRVFAISMSPHRVIFVDATDASRPILDQDFFPLEDAPGVFDKSAIDISGDFVYIATIQGLIVLDVSDTADPIQVGLYAADWVPTDLVVETDRAYVIGPEDGLRVIDVSDPGQPLEVGHWPASWEALDLDVSGLFAYVADGNAGLRIIGLEDPANPVEVASAGTPGTALKISVAGSTASVALGYEGVSIFDVSDPLQPLAVDRYTTDSSAWDVGLSGAKAYVLVDRRESQGRVEGGLRVVDLSIPARATEIASVEFKSTPIDVAVQGDVKYFANGDLGLSVVAPRAWGWLDTPGFARSVTPHGDFALVADDHKGLRIIDASDPTHLVEVAFVDTPGQSRRVAVTGDLALIADGDGGLRIIDISSPDEPVEIGSMNTPGQTVDIAIVEDLVYLADGPGGLRLIDISDPNRPADLTPKSYPVKNGARCLASVGPILYLADDDELGIYDISDPLSPRCLDEDYYLGGLATDIVATGNHAFVATRSVDGKSTGGVDVFDFSDHGGRLSQTATWGYPGDATGLAASNGRLYVATGEPEVPILDTRCLTTYWIDLVSHQAGMHGSRWRSDVIIGPRWLWTTDDASIEFTLHTDEGEFTGDATISPWNIGIFEDIVGILGYHGKGSLEIQSSIPLTVSSRAYHAAASGGTTGAYLPGYRSSDCLVGPTAAYLYGLREETGRYRTNISVTNTSSELQYVRIYLYAADGTYVGGFTLAVEPGMTDQDFQPYKYRFNRPDIGWGYAYVQVGHHTHGIITSATVIDSKTNDAVVVPMVRDAVTGVR